jgi:hypothetical protein
MEYKNKSLSIDEINIIADIDELSKNLDEIANSVKEIEETKDIVIEHIHNSNKDLNKDSDKDLNIFEGVISNTTNELSQILNYFNNNIRVECLINKLPDAKNKKKLKNVLKILSTNNKKYNNSPPIKIIVDKIKSKFPNEKNDIYTIISAGVDALMIVSCEFKLKLDSQLLSLIINIITHMLVELKIISTCEIIESHIDEMLVLYFYNRIILPTNRNCSLFSCFRNK